MVSQMRDNSRQSRRITLRLKRSCSAEMHGCISSSSQPRLADVQRAPEDQMVAITSRPLYREAQRKARSDMSNEP
jgi:hypothetical protein